MNTGQQFVKWLRPAGCVLFLGLFILVTVILFTAKGTPVAGYEAPYSSDYYAEHLDELAAEISENLIPKLDITAYDVAVVDGKVTVTAAEDDIYKIRPAVLHYYDAEMFEWVII